MSTLEEQRSRLRRTLGWTIVAALTVAALTASVAILSGDFDEGEWKVIATSLGFAVFSALGASGASLRLRGGETRQTLGSLTVVLAGASFLILVLALWALDDADAPWRIWGCLSLATLAASHACIVTAGRRPGDSEAVRTLVSASIGLAIVDAFAGILPLADVVDEVDEGAAKVIGVLVVALLLTTALPPILRRLQPPVASEARPTTTPRLADELLAVADRIESRSEGDGEIRRECERLRQLARSAAR